MMGILNPAFFRRGRFTRDICHEHFRKSRNPSANTAHHIMKEFTNKKSRRPLQYGGVLVTDNSTEKENLIYVSIIISKHTEIL